MTIEFLHPTRRPRPQRGRSSCDHRNSRREGRGRLTRAGLIDAVDLRLGDARESLAEIEGLVDLAFLDGRNDLYLEVLTRLEPRLSERAVIVADLSPNDPDLTAYLEYVRSGSFSRIELPVETGFEVSVLV